MISALDLDESARQRIRTSLDESLIVEAAAGTGKTSELIRRFVGIIRTGRTTVDRIVAVTFTRKAAGELRLRLRVELDNARAGAIDPGEHGYLENALARLEEAHIGTIHSFCAEILRQRPVEARIAPGFEEVDEEQAKRLYGRAFDGWIQRNLQSMPAGLCRTLSRASIEGPGERGPLERLRTAGRVLVEWRDFRQPWRRDPFNREAEIQQLVRDTESLAGIASECTVSNHPVRKHLQCVLDFIAKLRRSEEVGRADIDDLEAQLMRLSRDIGERHNKGPKNFSTRSRDEVIELKDRLASSLANFAQRANADLAALLQAEMQDLIDLYEDIKERSGKVDFFDLLTRTRDLIKESAEVRRLLQNGFSHIFVDEFQDTDPVQAEILMLLSADDPNQTDWHQVRPLPGKLFVVGDPKQSIYRFRRADIILYQELCERLSAQGIATLQLSRSFRAVRPIQDFINAAFAPEMQSNKDTGQPAYVPMEEYAPATDQPSVVALPVPHPYGGWGVTKKAIEESLPETIAAFVDWLIRDSGWRVRHPDGSGQLVPIASEHIAILFRRFMSYGTDLTRDYVRALEVRGIPHQLWQARSFHQREEVETLRAALNAIEWPDDELSVFATLKGSLFAIPDGLLLRFRHDVGAFNPFRHLPDDMHADFQPIREALSLIADLHRKRNSRSAAETVNTVLEAARAHAAFALRPSGNEALANVYHVCNLARAYELGGGYSFRGFVEQLNDESEREDSNEAPTLEDGSEGVRIVTVHSAKGLEFPIVILADITVNSAQREPDKHVNAEQNLCALRLMGCLPWELIEHREEEHARDLAEGVRIAYVAATRARDLLVVPAIGDGPFDNGWIATLNKALYPARSNYRQSQIAPKCPSFGEVTVLSRPMKYDGSAESSVRPGLHVPEGCTSPVVWWDPAILNLNVEANFGLRQQEILAEAGEEAQRGRVQYESWKSTRQQSIDRGRRPTVNVFVATDATEPPFGYSSRVQVERVERGKQRPRGPRFGTLVHLMMRDVDYNMKAESILDIAHTHARLLDATDDEAAAAAQAVGTALQHPLLERARKASRCHRELPILITDDIAGLLDAVIDLAFLEDTGWCVVDFKTDAENVQRLSKYRRQVGWYIHSIEKTTGMPARGYLLHL